MRPFLDPSTSHGKILPTMFAGLQGQVQAFGELLHPHRTIRKAAGIPHVGKAISEDYKTIKPGLLFSCSVDTAKSHQDSQ